MLRPLPAPLCLIFVLSACREETPIRIANEPPALQILDPVVGADGVAGPFGESEAIVMRVVTQDSEDLPGQLLIHFASVATDEGALRTELGTGVPDTGGFADFVVSGLSGGHHLLEALVTDSDGATAEARVPVLVLGEAMAPEVFITAPSDGFETTAGAPLTFAGTAADDGGPTALTAEWWSNLDGVLDTTPPSLAGLLTFTTSTLSEGTHAITLTVVDEWGQWATAGVSLTVVPANRPPTDPSVEVEPADPRTDDDLHCLVTVASTDPEGLPVELRYRWLRDGAPTGWEDPVLSADETSRGEAWTCEVRGFDGAMESGPGSATVIVGNTAPGGEDPTLSPSPGYENSVLTCAPTAFVDPDGDLPSWTFQWTVGGLPIAVTTEWLDGASFEHGDVVVCGATPDDGTELGPTRWSAPVLIENSAPTDPGVSVSPAPSAPPDVPLHCLVSVPASDLDLDLVGYEVRWLLDGVSQPAWDGLWTVDASATALGDVWTCEVRAEDGAGQSAWVAATTTVLPGPGDLVVTEYMANPSAVADAAGEWIELYNASGATLDLGGFEIADDDFDSHVVTGPLPVAPGGRVVIGRNEDQASNGGVFVSYEYSGFELDNGPDEIVIRFAAVEVDRVEYDAATYDYGLLGHSGTLDPALGLPSATANDFGASWCASMQPLGGGVGDFGTPGGPNDNCLCAPTDQDGDGFGDGGSCGAWDCDDNQAAVHPGGIEVCGNGIDEDCSGADTPCSCTSTDGDGDGYGDGPACSTIDCNDNNASVFPGATDLCNQVDDDCDTQVDEGWDLDADGWTQCEDDCDDGASSIHPTAPEACNSLDDDCDGPVDEGFDGDGDGWTSCAGDCNNSNPSIHPGQNDVCDGTDADCDGAIDENAAGDVFEPNNSSGGSYNIGGDDTIIDLWATIHVGTDTADWYQVSTTDDFEFLCDLFYITATLDSIPAGTDYDLYLYDGSLTLLDYSDAVSNTNETVYWEPGCTSPGDDGGLYYLRVARWSGSSCSDTYHLEVENLY